MDEPIRHRRRGPPSAFGIALVVLGMAALALREAGIGLLDLTPRWPFFIIVPGVVLLVLATLPKPPAGVWFAIAGSIVTTVGALLLYQQSTDAWETWAYTWTLIPAAAGVATLGYGLVYRRRELVSIGARIAAAAGVLFLAGLWFFGAVFATGRAGIDLATWGPAILIAIGVVVVIVSSLAPRSSRGSHAVDFEGSPRAERRAMTAASRGAVDAGSNGWPAAASLHRLSARDLASRIRSRDVSSVEAVEAALARIELVNPALGAVVSIDPAAALAAATSADTRLASGAPVGPLHGVPMTLKDGHDIAGLRTTIGTPALDRVADEDGAVAASLRAAGAILIGHTNVPPFLADYQSANPLFGRTVNPWDHRRTPAGSSGGAASAVAAGLTPLEVGSDMTGSLRLPAAFCGIYGLKPTEDRVPLTGFFRPPPGTPRSVRILLALGPMARDLADLELALRVLAGPDHRDVDVRREPVTTGAKMIALHGLRVAALEVVPGATVGTAMRAALRGVVDRLANAGAVVTEELPTIDWHAAATLFDRLLGTVTAIVDPGNDLDAEQRSLAWYLSALDRRDRIVASWGRFFEDVDVLVIPAAMSAAFVHTEPYGNVDVDGQPVPYLAHGTLHTFANLAGLPALVVPAGPDPDGMPLGIQLVGPPWGEARLVAIARAMEEAGVLPGHAWPPEA